MAEGEQPKIIIDDDWKAQAQAERAKLAEQEKAKQTDAPAGDAQPEKLGFSDLVQMLASQALMYMGAVADPQTGRAVVSPPMAQAHIDLLGVLEEKTKGNLDEEEGKLLSGIAHELRTQFVELSKAIEQAIAEGQIKVGPDGQLQPVAGGGTGPAGTPGAGPGGGLGGVPPMGPA